MALYSEAGDRAARLVAALLSRELARGASDTFAKHAAAVRTSPALPLFAPSASPTLARSRRCRAAGMSSRKIDTRENECWSGMKLARTEPISVSACPIS